MGDISWSYIFIIKRGYDEFNSLSEILCDISYVEIEIWSLNLFSSSLNCCLTTIGESDIQLLHCRCDDFNCLCFNCCHSLSNVSLLLRLHILNSLSCIKSNSSVLECHSRVNYLNNSCSSDSSIICFDYWLDSYVLDCDSLVNLDNFDWSGGIDLFCLTYNNWLISVGLSLVLNYNNSLSCCSCCYTLIPALYNRFYLFNLFSLIDNKSLIEQCRFQHLYLCLDCNCLIYYANLRFLNDNSLSVVESCLILDIDCWYGDLNGLSGSGCCILEVYLRYFNLCCSSLSCYFNCLSLVLLDYWLFNFCYLNRYSLSYSKISNILRLDYFKSLSFYCCDCLVLSLNARLNNFNNSSLSNSLVWCSYYWSHIDLSLINLYLLLRDNKRLDHFNYWGFNCKGRLVNYRRCNLLNDFGNVSLYRFVAFSDPINRLDYFCNLDFFSLNCLIDRSDVRLQNFNRFSDSVSLIDHGNWRLWHGNCCSVINCLVLHINSRSKNLKGLFDSKSLVLNIKSRHFNFLCSSFNDSCCEVSSILEDHRSDSFSCWGCDGSCSSGCSVWSCKVKSGSRYNMLNNLEISCLDSLILSSDGWFNNLNICLDCESIVLSSNNRLLNNYGLLSDLHNSGIIADWLNYIYGFISSSDCLSLVYNQWWFDFFDSYFTNCDRLVLLSLWFNDLLYLSFNNFNNSLIELNLWLGCYLFMSSHKGNILSSLSDILDRNFWLRSVDFISCSFYCCCDVGWNWLWNLSHNSLDDSLVHLNLRINNNSNLLNLCDIYSNIFLCENCKLNSLNSFYHSNYLWFSLILTWLSNYLNNLRSCYNFFVSCFIGLISWDYNRWDKTLVDHSGSFDNFNACLIKDRSMLLSSDIHLVNLICCVCNISCLVLYLDRRLLNFSFLSFDHFDNCNISLNLRLLSDNSCSLCELNCLVGDVE